LLLPVQGRFGFAGTALIWSTRERNSYCSPVSRLSRGFDIAASDSSPAGLVESRFDSPENQQIELQEDRTKRRKSCNSRTINETNGKTQSMA
jgi:hypothetical protein